MKCDKCQQNHLEVRTVTVPDSRRATTILCMSCWNALQLWLRTPPEVPRYPSVQCLSRPDGTTRCLRPGGHEGAHYY